MKTFCYSLLAAAALLIAGCKSPGAQVTPVSSLSASDLHPFGRSVLSDSLGLEMIGSAVHFGFSFTGTECRLYTALAAPEAHNYLQYELDGQYQHRIRVNGQDSLPVIIEAPSEGRHTVWVYKATEAHTGPIFIKKIEADEVQPLEKTAAPLIEFIGNSITCGAAADPSEVPCGTGAYHDQHNAYQAYGPRVARALGANFLMSSVSGIGIYRNWNSDGPTMPQVYEMADLHYNSGRAWDFGSYHPAVVSIALGTNDYSSGDGRSPRGPFDPEVFTEHYIQFVELVKSKYPTAQLILLSSPMMNGERRETLQRCLTKVKDTIDAAYPEDKPVALHFFAPMQAGGCTGHPNVEDHAVLAQELIPVFKKLLAQ